MSLCVCCRKETKYRGIPYTLCEKCQPIIENFIKATKFSGEVFRDAVEVQTKEQFKVKIDARIAEIKNNSGGVWECCIEELIRIKKAVL